MNRRGFLKVISALGASVALPVTGTSAEEAASMLASGSSPLALIRETVAYDIGYDAWVIRFDILFGDDCKGGRLSSAGDTQLSFDARLRDKDEDRGKAREVAVTLFENELLACGKTWADLKPLRNIGIVQ